MSYEPQQPRPDYRSEGGRGIGGPDPHVSQYQGAPRTGSSGPQDDEKTVAVLTHLAGPVAALVSAGWLGFVGPLVVWFIYKDKSPFLRGAAAGAFNFNVTLWLVNVAGWICIFTVILLPLGVALIIAYWVMLLVCHIMAAVKAGRGEVYRYPMQLPILH
ncbi:hypothetical protein KVA01_22180 [Kocuria varians]|uniref:Orotate phosphoribosyltransferase n=1 Tax=Kocuria varians TaxID=1272 RepID=A0A4Y4D8Y3_KOCVA|nr:DUF4870 domain-containing protein [Kocuria varians]GED00064.1 hypothetical protein KVA01_22180 [Kocuria varians]